MEFMFLRIFNVKCSAVIQILIVPCYGRKWTGCVCRSLSDLIPFSKVSFAQFSLEFQLYKTLCRAVGNQHCVSKVSGTAI